MNAQSNFSPARAVSWYCGTGATMNILNYFWWTNFWLKDTFDVQTLIRFGLFDWNERPTEFEIALFLATMNFSVEYFSMKSPGDLEYSIKDPEAHQKVEWYKLFPFMNAESDKKAITKFIDHPNCKIIESTHLDIIKIIKERSDNQHMFLFMPDYFLLHNKENPNNKHGGHIVASPWYNKLTGEIDIFESTPEDPVFISLNHESLKKCYQGNLYIFCISQK